MTVAEKLKPCRVCSIATTGTQCDHHAAPVTRDSHKESAAKRGYNYKWQKFRKRYLMANPWCCDCLKRGKYTSAREIHHITKLIDAPHLKYALSNLMGLCSRCHAVRSCRGE